MRKPLPVPYCIIHLLTGLFIASYTGCSRPSIDINIPQTDIQHGVEQKYPETETYAGIAQITLQDPRIVLGKSKNRLTMSIDVAVSPRGFGGHRSEQFPAAGAKRNQGYYL